MTNFSKYLLNKKLEQLNESQESIETLSLWILHHYKHAKTIVEHWSLKFNNVSEKQKILLLFLANEIIRPNKEKTRIFRDEFQKVLPDILHQIGKTFFRCNLTHQTHRILHIWRDTELFSEKTIKHFWTCLNESSSTSPIEAENYEIDDYDSISKIKKLYLAVKAPHAEELINALESFYDLPSGNKHTRNKIANLPTNLFEYDAIFALKDNKEASKYAEKLEEARKLVDNYNKLLELELKERKKFHEMLIGYEEVERERIDEIEQKLKQVKSDLDEKIHFQEELQRHRNSLPDLNELYNVMILPPLPSAQDLFKTKAIN